MNYNKIFSDFKNIKFKNVNFFYKNRTKKNLIDINLDISRNDIVGIVGPSGSGKSTLINLLLGLLIPSSGSIEADNVDINSSIINWRSCIGYVPQSIFLLNESLKNNIAFGVPEDNISASKLMQCISQSQLETFFSDLPDGLLTKLGERGTKISGGELQRIGIARALYFDPNILIFDESTSALDHEIEQKLLDEIYNFKNNKTIIFITHRNSTLKYCNKIYKINEGSLSLLNNENTKI
jgi:ABC-type bacteriocin/lantibiotic exporter with double-glycine peptidase domain